MFLSRQRLVLTYNIDQGQSSGLRTTEVDHTPTHCFNSWETFTCYIERPTQTQYWSSEVNVTP